MSTDVFQWARRGLTREVDVGVGDPAGGGHQGEELQSLLRLKLLVETTRKHVGSTRKP